MKAYADVTDSRVVKALAHPLRVQILAALEDRVASPNELANELQVDLGSVSYHVRRLVHLGFLNQVDQVPRRGAIEHYYTAIAGPRITDAAWSSVPTIVKRAMVGATVETVGRLVTTAASAGGFDVADAHLTRTPVAVDAQGWRELASELRCLTDRLAEIERDSAARLAESPAAETQATVVLMLFDSSDVAQAPPVGRSRLAAGRHKQSANAEFAVPAPETAGV
ncbi:MAG TPA: winged helix-turn-helix domain-containing protein [Solirubrobacteraceae bacterium]|jgi:DNA-binding transcriptional ArsR family regulator|nr:winged helix-turn-helix domain-containing protein [Solirubrobacteraceae bacterium]